MGSSLINLLHALFLDAYTHLYKRLCPSARRSFWSVGPSVGPSVRHILLCYDFYFFTSQHLPKWSSDLKNGPWPPASDWGSRVSGLVNVLLCSFCQQWLWTRGKISNINLNRSWKEKKVQWPAGRELETLPINWIAKSNGNFHASQFWSHCLF